MRSERLLKVFKALSDPTRLQIFIYLLETEFLQPCSSIRELFKLSQPTMSHHFSVLLEAEVIIKDKDGTSNYYQVNTVYLKTLGFILI